MKYTEIVGEISIIYEGTAQEIMDLYNKMNPSEKPKEGYYCNGKEYEGHMPLMGDKGPELIIPKGGFKTHNPCQPIDIKPNNPTFEHNITINCETNIDKVADEIAKNLSTKINNIAGI